MLISEIYRAAGIDELPIDPVWAARAVGIKVVSYKTLSEVYNISASELYADFPLGFSFHAENSCVIAVNEHSCGERRRRFTVAHELGHCALGHLDLLDEGKTLTPREERLADEFASELLAPSAVLCAIGVNSADTVAKMCGISAQAATICLNKLRQMKGKPLDEEKSRIAEIFSDYIQKKLAGKRVFSSVL